MHSPEHRSGERSFAHLRTRLHWRPDGITLFTIDETLDPKADTASSVGVAYKSLPNDVRAGDVLLLNDGQIVLDVTAVDAPRIATRVSIGGELSDNKGINKQGGGLSAGALTDKDRQDIKLAPELNVDY